MIENLNYDTGWSRIPGLIMSVTRSTVILIGRTTASVSSALAGRRKLPRKFISLTQIAHHARFDLAESVALGGRENVTGLPWPNSLYIISADTCFAYDSHRVSMGFDCWSCNPTLIDALISM